MRFKRLNENRQYEKAYNEIADILMDNRMDFAYRKLNTAKNDYESTLDDEQEVYKLSLMYGLGWFLDIKNILEKNNIIKK